MPARRQRSRLLVGIVALLLPLLGACDTDPIIPLGPQALDISWSCSYAPAGAVPGTSSIVPGTPPLSGRQQQFVFWFNQTAIAANPALANVYIPFATLVGIDNAIANRGFVAWNPDWFMRIGERNATAILAHELAHIAQFYSLVSAAPPVGTLFEGQADYVAGWMLRRSGTFSSQDAQHYAQFVTIFGGAGSSSHPPGQTRAQLFLAGYNEL